MENSDKLVETMQANDVVYGIAQNVKMHAFISDRYKGGNIDRVDAAHELILIPSYMRVSYKELIDEQQSGVIAEGIIHGLYDDAQNPDWLHKSKKYTYDVSQSVTDTYWSFDDHNEITWYVSEVRDRQETSIERGLRVFISLNQPIKHKELISADEERQIRKTVKEAHEAAAFLNKPIISNRRNRAGKALGKWLRGQASSKPSSNRWL